MRPNYGEIGCQFLVSAKDVVNFVILPICMASLGLPILDISPSALSLPHLSYCQASLTLPLPPSATSLKYPRSQDAEASVDRRVFVWALPSPPFALW